MTPDYGEAMRFLRWLYPSGPWLLTAIPFSRSGEFPTARFNPSDERQVMIWLLQHEEMNLYYHVNETVESALTRKATKQEIARVHFLQIDMDVRKSGETEDEAHARIIARLTQYGHRPSALVNSGGGFNALWRLSLPLTMTGEEAVEAVESRNRQLAADLEGDVTHDISRILRLPGTVNRLNQTKVDRGRTPSLSSLVWMDDSVHDFGSFMAAPTAPKNRSTSASPTSADPIHTEDVDQLQIPATLKTIIKLGRDPEKPGSVDRSAVLWYVCCEMVRLGIDERVILGIITDSRYTISDHVYAQGARWMQYALRQIGRARDRAHDPDLMRMNDRFAVIQNHSGRCVILLESRSPTDPPQFQSPKEFFNAHDNEKKLITDNRNPEKPKQRLEGIGTWWFDQRMRRQFDRVVFEPGMETPGDLNLWQGFAVEPRPGSAHLRYLEHVRENICRGDAERYEYLIRWMARVVQRPRTQSMVAPVLLGDRGTGKSVFATLFADLFGVGKHAFVAKDAQEITGRFNSHLASVVLLLSEEAFDIGDRRHESVLKELITGKTLAMEGKYASSWMKPNYVHLMMTSNKERVIPAGDKERRFFVIRVGEKRWTNEQFGALVREMTEDGLSHLLHHLLELDLSSFDVTQYPETTELREQQDHSISREDDWLMAKLEAGSWLSTARVSWRGPVIKEWLYKDYLQTMASLNVPRPMSSRQFGMWLSRSLPEVTDKQLSPQRDRSRPWAFLFQALDTCRVHFAARRGMPGHVWPVIDVTDEEDAGQGSGQSEVFS